MADSGDYYAVLGITREATDADIKKAFRSLAHEYHPDRVGEDATKIERFKLVREAYETLSDPAKRATYDRRRERRANQSPFVGSHWRHAGTPSTAGVGNRATAAAGNNIDLEDIFNDFGGVDLNLGRHKGAAPKPAPPPRRGPDVMRDFREAAERGTWPGAGEGGGAGNGGEAGGPRPSGFGFSDGGWSSGTGRPPPRPGDRRVDPQAGDDVHVAVPLSATLLGIGGLVTVEYDRTVRADDGVSLLSVRELHELRVPPDVRDGDELRVAKLGHAGAGGGPYGDLVAKINVVGAAPRMKMPRAGEAAADDEVIKVDVPFTEALLGGRVELDTPQGRVRVSIPAGTSSGTRFRLRGKGRASATGEPGDLYAEVRITVPKTLDDESRKLIERFAQLNPQVG